MLMSNDPDRVASQRDLAISCLANGQVDKAIELMEYVVQISSQACTEDNCNFLDSQLALAAA